MTNDTQAPAEKKSLNVRNLPAWAASAIQRKAGRLNVSYSDQVRAILCAAAIRYQVAEKQVLENEREAQAEKA